MNSYQLALEQEEYVIGIRRDIHKYPEIGGEEARTLSLIERELARMGIGSKRVEGGIVGMINGKRPGKRLVLRADVDGLPMQESPNNLKMPKAVCSQVAGKGHTCGHDGHTAMLLGAAQILNNNREAFNGEIILAFEQGEENGKGKMLIEHLRRKGADGCFGIHLKADLPSGTVSVESGPRMSARMDFDVTLIGRGGHGSRPDLANNPLDCFASIYHQLQEMRTRILTPFYPLEISVCKIEMGTTAAIIPQEMRFAGTMRFTHCEESAKPAAAHFEHVIEKTCALYGCTYQYNRRPVPNNLLVENHFVCSKLAEQAVVTALNADALIHCNPWMASESMAIYMRYFPGVFAFLGTMNKEKGIGADHHNIHFDIDEDVLKLGVALTVEYATSFLAFKGDLPFNKSLQSVSELLAGMGK